MSPLSLLARTDKHYLGAGCRLLWAPPFPLHLDRPGFWDKAHYFNAELQPLFTWTLLDDEGRELTLEHRSRDWRPDRLRQTYRTDGGDTPLAIEEEKTILPNDTAVCQITLRSAGARRRVHLVAWTVQEHDPSGRTTWLENVAYRRGIVCWTKQIRAGSGAHFPCAMALGVTRRVVSHALQLSEGKTMLPWWRHTPFYEKFRGGRLPSTVQLTGVTDDGLVYAAIHTTLVLTAGGVDTVTVALSAGSDMRDTEENLHRILKIEDPVEISRLGWCEYFLSVPHFTCSDERLTRYYWYRWYGLRLNTIRAHEGNYAHPVVCEGIGYFRAPISYSAFCHMLENRWRHTPGLARGSLLTFIDNQRPDGGFRGYIDPHHYRQEMFYHADWGNALVQLDSIHPSPEFLREAYEGLSRYARYFDRERDEEISGLYDIDNHYETGQEYMRRYLAVNPDADRENWGEVFRLKGVDVTVYIYNLKRALARVASTLGRGEEADLWTLEAERTKKAILDRMWDGEEEMFFDINPATGERTKVKAAVCFYPYFTDIVSEAHLPGLVRHLFNPREFWTPWPVPSSSADDPTFCAEPEWKQKRMNCPWNGRVWPMTNSHIAEALAGAAIRFGDRRLKRRTAEFIGRYIRMMFTDGDLQRPNSFEHYNPLTGAASVYRGVDDYQHSWVVDLIVRFVCGIRPDGPLLTVDPFPFGLTHATIDRVLVRGHIVRVAIRRGQFSVEVDGQKRGRSPIGRPITLALE